MIRSGVRCFTFECLLVLLFGLPTLSHARLEILTTTHDLASITEDIGSDQVLVIPMIQPNDDPHVGATSRSIRVPLEHVDLLIVTGLELESHWLPPLLRGKAGERFQVGSVAYLDASDGCAILETPHGVADQSLGGSHPYGNPHYWLDPENGRRMANTIAQRLSNLDPVHGVEYQENLRQFEATLTDKETQWAALADPLKSFPLVELHDSWANFAAAFHLNIVDTIEPLPGSPPSPERIAETITTIRDQHAAAIVWDDSSASSIPAALASATGAKSVQLATSVNDTQDIQTYFDLFDHDLKQLRDALLAP